jgi:hypothetical protein
MNHILERQMSRDRAAPHAIDYDAYRARASAERQQARHAATASVLRFIRRTRLASAQAVIAAATLLGAILLAFGAANAAPPSLSSSQCVSQLNSCNANCDRYTHGAFRTSCYNRCASQFRNCLSIANGVDPYPHRPNGANNHAPPTAGTKADPNPLTSTTNNSAPFGTGILGGGNGMGGNGPSSTGSPAGGGMKPPSAPPAAPPVILR